MKVGVIGAGYVGLVAAACFAESGNQVVCADVDVSKVDRLNRGEIPIYEPGLDRLVESNCEDGRLKFTTDISQTVKQSKVIFIAVGTPQDADGSADLKYVLQVAAEIGRNMDGHKIIVNKSTVPVGTADLVTAEISKFTKHPFDVVSNPEFLKEGAAIGDFMKPDRVVIGVANSSAAAVMQELYEPFCRTGKPILVMDVRSAELTKYASNALLATKVTFMNEISNLCEKLGADVNQVRKGVGSDSRIGPSFLFPGVGYGGSCFPKDVRALTKTAANVGMNLELVKAVDRVNEFQKTRLVEKVVRHFVGPAAVTYETTTVATGETVQLPRYASNCLAGKKIAAWGLAFKPNTDDMREAPSLTILGDLVKLGAEVTAYDPEATSVAKGYFKEIGCQIEYVDNSYAALDGADALLVITEWGEFRRPDFEKMKSSMRGALVFDGRNIFDPELMQREGFVYYSMGRPTRLQTA